MSKSIRLLAAAASLGCIAGALPAAAVPVVLTFDGTLGAGNDFTTLSGKLNLDVNGGFITSGTGSISIYGLTDAALSLITVTTPGNNGGTGPSAPIGYRANDGTDLNGADQIYPFTANGPLFAVGTTMPEPNGAPLINFYDDGNGGYGVLFTGVVDGVEHYAVYNPSSVTFTQEAAAAVPEPASWAMMILGVGAIGAAARRRKANTRVTFAVA